MVCLGIHCIWRFTNVWRCKMIYRQSKVIGLHCNRNQQNSQCQIKRKFFGVSRLLGCQGGSVLSCPHLDLAEALHRLPFLPQSQHSFSPDLGPTLSQLTSRWVLETSQSLKPKNNWNNRRRAVDSPASRKTLKCDYIDIYIYRSRLDLILQLVWYLFAVRKLSQEHRVELITMRS